MKHPRPIDIFNEHGRRFTIRLVTRGERYGRDDCLEHDEDDPLVEFYDSTRAPEKTLAGRGNFVSRYYASTLTGDCVSLERRGLSLQGDNPEWSVDGSGMTQVFRWLCHVEE